jgi:OOP family OmpA-OmpF porin
MKKVISSFLLCFALLEVHGQVNLVPNPSFEINSLTNSCYSSIDSVDNWFNPHAATPDYFTFNGSCQGVSAINNPLGFQTPIEGSSYAGIIAYVSPTREYIATKFISTLEQQNYKLEFYISLANESKYAIKSIGAYFTDDTSGFKSQTMNLLVQPQIENQNIFLDDTLDWIKISGNYSANGIEKFLIIGNFRNDNNTEKKIINTSSPDDYAYYYVDKVSLILNELNVDDLFDLDSFSIISSPFNDYVEIQTTQEMDLEINLFSIDGSNLSNKLKIEQKGAKNWIVLTDNLSSGQYFINVNNSFCKKIIKM